MLLLTVSFAVVLSVALLMIYYLVYYIDYSDFSEKMTSFECGFDPLSSMRTPFSTRFFLLVVLFLIFDVEVALLFPVLSSIKLSSETFLLLSAILLFLAILLLGMFHEWNEGALDWVSSSTGQLSMSYWAHNPTMVLPLSNFALMMPQPGPKFMWQVFVVPAMNIKQYPEG